MILIEISTLPENDRLTEKKQNEKLEIAISITKYSSKICKSTSYDEAINNPIHGQRWRNTIEEELQNLQKHQVWEYNELPPGRKVIGSK